MHKIVDPTSNVSIMSSGSTNERIEELVSVQKDKDKEK